MTFAQLFVGLVVIYAIVVTALFVSLRDAFNNMLQAQSKADEARAKAVDNFFNEVDWILKYTESEEVEKSVNKLKKMMELVE